MRVTTPSHESVQIHWQIVLVAEIEGLPTSEKTVSFVLQETPFK
jgi:hypothetical protein